MVADGRTSMMLMEAAGPIMDERVLVEAAAAGGVGTLLVQLAKAAGAKVVAATGARRHRPDRELSHCPDRQHHLTASSGFYFTVYVLTDATYQVAALGEESIDLAADEFDQSDGARRSDGCPSRERHESRHRARPERLLHDRGAGATTKRTFLTSRGHDDSPSLGEKASCVLSWHHVS